MVAAIFCEYILLYILTNIFLIFFTLSYSLDVSNGNYDNYGGITDSLLSAEASKDSKVEPTETNHHSGGGGGQPQRGPLLDFKSAFSDLDTKPSDLRLVVLKFTITFKMFIKTNKKM